MASQVRRYELSGLGFDITSEVAVGAILSVSQRSATLVTIDVTIDDAVPNAADDTDESMLRNGWGFVAIIP